MNPIIKVGVVGVGHLGTHHARLYSEIAKRSNGQCEFIGLCDTDRLRGRALTEKYGGGTFESAEELANFVDAVSIATPTDTHFNVARVFLERGKHVLVEKPITNNVSDAEKLVALARQNNCLLQVGHVERFNPVLRYLNEVVAEARFLEVHRLSPYPGRSTDIGVVLDLMIHDLDVVLSLVKSPLEKIDAIGIPVLSTTEDIANARLKFANGCVANITASRVSPEKMRKIRLFGRTDIGAAYISLDYMKQEGEVYRVAEDNAQESGLLKKLLAGKHATIVSEFAGKKIVREPVPIERDEPLKLELQHFIESVRLRRQPLVTGEAAKQALEVAMEITERVGTR
ncbi:MAG: scyllo-inositol 2-dehydrogenase (NAD(+)) [Verrucomicrobiae bacterium]|nr:scyllo-inositol 2-dehydrogenase (NAD(+)) [Verrucomicrobiae bacterium]